MIRHYLTLSVRNLLKYKTQSLVSILGLAVGFACFALVTMWIRYEMTYDTEHRDAERLYTVCSESMFSKSGYVNYDMAPMGNALKKHLPEVEAGFTYQKWEQSFIVNGLEKDNISCMFADSCLTHILDVTLLEGNWEFLHNKNLLAVTEEGARKLFGTTEGILGRQLKNSFSNEESTVCALLHVRGLAHSNLYFDVWNEDERVSRFLDSWLYGGFSHCIKLHEEVSVKVLQEKMKRFKDSSTARGDGFIFKETILMPLSEYHYSEVNDEQPIAFHYLILFSAIGALVILSSLFNYLALFITRMEIRRREMELRRVCGSSRGALVGMMLWEYGALIVAAGLVGMTLVEWCMRPFREMSGVTGNIYVESAYYFLFVFLLSLLLLVPFAWHSGSPRRSVRGRRFLLYRVSILFQLFVGVLFIFAVSVLLKQMYYLKNTDDLGFERRGRAVLLFMGMNSQQENYQRMGDCLSRLAGVDTVYRGYFSIFPSTGKSGRRVEQWDGKPAEATSLDVIQYPVDETLIDFYGLQLREGDWPMNKGKFSLVLNESAVRKMGLEYPVGKKVGFGGGEMFTVVGVVKDFCLEAPTVPVKPVIMVHKPEYDKAFGFSVDFLVKYHPGRWEELKAAVGELLVNEFPHYSHLRFENLEEAYDGFLKSEQMLMKLLLVVSLVCIAVCAFGIFSLVTLSCEQRRKEIAIRKVNGARVGDILRMFVCEYLLMLVAAAAVAFPIGYLLMKRWLEGYVRQTFISWWIYLFIFIGIALVIALCIGWRVWRTARANPAEVVKRE